MSAATLKEILTAMLYTQQQQHTTMAELRVKAGEQQKKDSDDMTFISNHYFDTMRQKIDTLDAARDLSVEALREKNELTASMAANVREIDQASWTTEEMKDFADYAAQARSNLEWLDNAEWTTDQVEEFARESADTKSNLEWLDNSDWTLDGIKEWASESAAAKSNLDE